MVTNIPSSSFFLSSDDAGVLAIGPIPSGIAVKSVVCDWHVVSGSNATSLLLEFAFANRIPSNFSTGPGQAAYARIPVAVSLALDSGTQQWSNASGFSFVNAPPRLTEIPCDFIPPGQFMLVYISSNGSTGGSIAGHIGIRTEPAKLDGAKK